MPLIERELIEEISELLCDMYPETYLAAFDDDEHKEVLREQILHLDDHLDKKKAKREYKKLLDTTEKIDYLMSHLVGFGFLDDIKRKFPNVTDTKYTGTDLIVKKNDADPFIYDEEEITKDDVLSVINRFAIETDQEFTTKSTEMDAQVGLMRMNAVHERNAVYGPTFHIRFTKAEFVLTRDSWNLFADDCLYEFFENMMQIGSNMLLLGQTGTGKTEFQKLLVYMLVNKVMNFRQVVITVEDTPEGHFKDLNPHKNITSWQTGTNLSFSNLIKDGLRNDANWIIVTEARAEAEANDLFQAVRSGHFVVTSLHASSGAEAPYRYLGMMTETKNLNEKTFFHDFFANFDLGCKTDATYLLKGYEGKTVRYLSEVVEYLDDGEVQVVYKRWVEKGEFKSEIHPISEKLARRMLAEGIDLKRLKEAHLVGEIQPA